MSTRADEAAAVRADRAPAGTYRLAPPRRLDSGAIEFEAVISTPGVNPYPDIGRVEYVGPEALSDAEYLDALRGIPLIDAQDLHWPGVTVDQLAAARIGTVLDGRWDAEQQATIARMVVDTPRGIEQIQIRGVDGVSLHYTPDTEPATEAPDGTPVTHRQTKRRGINHLLLTPRPNDPSARIRADEASMTPDEIKALIDALTERLTAMESRMDAMQPAKPAEEEAAAVVEPPRADTAADWQAVHDLAGAHGIKIAPTASLVDAQRAIVVARMPQRADAATMGRDTLAGLIAGLAAGTQANDVWRRIDGGGTVRGDAARTSPIADLLTPGV